MWWKPERTRHHWSDISIWQNKKPNCVWAACKKQHLTQGPSKEEPTCAKTKTLLQRALPSLPASRWNHTSCAWAWRNHIIDSVLGNCSGRSFLHAPVCVCVSVHLVAETFATHGEEERTNVWCQFLQPSGVAFLSFLTRRTDPTLLGVNVAAAVAAWFMFARDANFHSQVHGCTLIYEQAFCVGLPGMRGTVTTGCKRWPSIC